MLPKMHYPDLDPHASYRLRVVYGAGPMELKANDNLPIHGLINRPYEILNFDIPPADGQRHARPGLACKARAGGRQRGCQVAEVWLMKRNRTRWRRVSPARIATVLGDQAA